MWSLTNNLYSISSEMYTHMILSCQTDPVYNIQQLPAQMSWLLLITSNFFLLIKNLLI